MSRMYKRFQIDHPAIVTVSQAEYGERIFLLRTVDISAAGAMFRSEVQLFPGIPVKVVFLIRRWHSEQCRKLRVTFSGRVVRCEPGRFAVAFDKVHPIIVSHEEAPFLTVK